MLSCVFLLLLCPCGPCDDHTYPLSECSGSLAHVSHQISLAKKQRNIQPAMQVLAIGLDSVADTVILGVT